jgi:hypothetical protein
MTDNNIRTENLCVCKDAGGRKMSIFPYQVNEVVSLYNRISKINPSSIIEKEKEEPQDVVNISSEARKKQIFEQARSEVMVRIRQVK